MLAWQNSDNILYFKIFNTHCTIFSIDINSLFSMLYSMKRKLANNFLCFFSVALTSKLRARIQEALDIVKD